MPEHIREIAERLREMREISGLSIEDMGERLTVSAESYGEMESGEVDIPVSVLCEAAEIYGITVTELLTGQRAKLRMFAVVRKGKGEKGTEETEGYDYRTLAHTFAARAVEPLLVKVQPGQGDENRLNAHAGHEFHYILEGRMKFIIGDREAVVTEGDSIYFDARYPHAMVALDGKPVRLLVVVINKDTEEKSAKC